MYCDICEFLKKQVIRFAIKSTTKEFLEMRRLARNHYRRFHPNPFDEGLDEAEFMNYH